MELDDTLYTVVDVARILKTSKNRVYSLINAGILPALSLGGWKVRKTSLCKFLEEYDGCDLTDVNNIKKCESEQIV